MALGSWKAEAENKSNELVEAGQRHPHLDDDVAKTDSN